jgi:hypothetical protein
VVARNDQLLDRREVRGHAGGHAKPAVRGRASNNLKITGLTQNLGQL